MIPQGELNGTPINQRLRNTSRKYSGTHSQSKKTREGREAPKRVWIDWLPTIAGRLYQILDTGEVWSTEGERFLVQDKSKKYLEADLKDEGSRQKVLVHRLVARAFIGPVPPEKPEVNHINGDTHFNVPSNLEYVSRSENIRHRNEVLHSDKGGGVSRHTVKCPHCSAWITLSPAKGRNG